LSAEGREDRGAVLSAVAVGCAVAVCGPVAVCGAVADFSSVRYDE
jgi:hypothetical protein